MKTIFTAVIFLLITTNIAAQITSNIRAGYWSDPASWSKNIVPNGTDSVVLHFDIVIDENAACKYFNANGKKVTVNTGVNLSVGKPVPSADTATILTIKNYTSNQGVFSDTLTRVIKNDFINGLKRIVITETSMSEPANHTVFNYNTQQQLTGIHNFYDDPAYGDYYVIIQYGNNRIVKITSSYDGYDDVVDTLIYGTNGANSTIQNRSVYASYNFDSSISYIQETMKILTISPLSIPINRIFYSYLLNGFSNETTNDTTVQVYNHDGTGNLIGYNQFYSRKITRSTNPPIKTRDTTITNYQRNGPDSSTLFKVLLNIYGKELLTYINFDLTDLTIADVTGFDGDPPFHGPDDLKKSLSSVFYTFRNGVASEEVDNLQLYRSINNYDSKPRLIKSTIDDGGNVDYIIFRELIYPN